VKECGIQICDEDRAVRKFAGHTTMVERIVPKSELSQVRFYILPADDLPLVCTNLLRLDKGKNATAHGISLAIHVNEYQVDEDQDNTDSNGMPTVQSNTSRLLDPFRSLYGISSVQITGLVSDEYKSAVIADITKARPTPEQHVNELISVLRAAETARKASSSLEALSYYNALEERILRFRLSALIPEGAHTLTSDEYAGSLLCDVTVDITFRKNHGSAISYMQLKDYAEARKYLQTALVPLYERDEGEGIPIKPAVLTELAMMNARAGRAVGLPRTTTRELEAYLRYKPDDSIVRAELGRLKEELAGEELAREVVAKQKLEKLKLVEEELAKLLADEDLVDQELVNRAVEEQELILLEYAMMEEFKD